MAKKSETLLRETLPTPPWRLALSGIVPFVLGLALVGVTFGEEPDATGGMAQAAEDPRSTGQVEAGTPEESSADPDSQTPEIQAPVETQAEASNEEVEPELAVIPADLAMGTPVTEDAPEAPVVEAPVVEAPVVEAPVVEAPVVNTPRPPSNTQFVRGRLAYLRCGSMADADGRCPRDRDLELSAWSALEAANRCGLGEGSTDVRLHFSGAAPELLFRDYGEPPLELGALQACLAPHVASLRSTLPENFVLSMRLTLR